MADNRKLQPIIIKRARRQRHVPHGGAWKIAYADFVTAMMAFFLLMWLLGSTAKGELEGIASYFHSPARVSLMGGEGSGGSDSLLPGGGRDLTRSTGQGASGEADASRLSAAQMARAELARQDALRIDGLHGRISALIASSPALSEFRSQIQLEKTAEGLHIQIVDEQRRPMFDTGSAVVKPHMRDILRAIGGALGDVENRLSLAGHTDAVPYGSGLRGYSNWELSADRANASRRELVAGGLPDQQLLRVEGLASSQLRVPEHPADAANRRISIIVLTREAQARLLPALQLPPSAVVAPTPGAGLQKPPALPTSSAEPVR
jgi:chemotaxis protein MotB